MKGWFAHRNSKGDFVLSEKVLRCFGSKVRQLG